jgi:hypothetical protein
MVAWQLRKFDGAHHCGQKERDTAMNTTTSNDSTRHTTLVLICTVGAIVLAWSGILDGLSAQYIDNALLGSGAIYATARGINALVSVLQGTEMNAFLLTFTVGELLDPINDLIERFSSVMMLALGSLALQKILLEVVSDFTFNFLLTALGGGVIATRYLGPTALYGALARFFFVTVVIRFSFAAVVLANSWADAVFLQDRVQEQHEAMQVFHDELGLVGARAGIETGLADEIQEVEAGILRNEKARGAESTSRSLNQHRLEEAQAKLADIDNRSWFEKLRGDTTVDIEGLKARIRKLESDIEDNGYALSALTEAREALDDKLECLKKRKRGESCSLFDSAARAAQALGVRQQIDELVQQVDDFASNLINLLMALILKSVIFPLLFLYILVRTVRYSLEKKSVGNR